MIYGFYHIGVLGRWESIFHDQISLLKSSGLYKKTSKIFVGIAGEKVNIIDEKTQIAAIDPVLQNGEICTLRFMHEFCQSVDPCKIWYIHTKGARFTNDFEVHVIPYVELWRKYMEYFNIEKHEDCIQALDEYDICGTELRGSGTDFYPEFPMHYCGNFWWANSEYIKNLTGIFTNTSLYQMGLHTRHLAECDFLARGNPKAKNFFNFDFDILHKNLCLESIYKNA